MNATYYLKILICRTSTAGADAQAMTFNHGIIPGTITHNGFIYQVNIAHHHGIIAHHHGIIAHHHGDL